MKMKFLTAGIIAALMVPAVASAQPHPPQNSHDRARAEAMKQDQRHPLLRGKPDQRDQRHVAPQNSRNHRADWRDEQRYRSFHAPFGYQRFQAGSTLRPSHYGQQYRPAWDSRWDVPRAKKNQSYVRHYNDLLLVNDRNGKVIRVYRDMFRRR